MEMRDTCGHTMQKAITGKAQSKGANSARSAQDRFLSQMIEERQQVTVFLVNGIRLEGRITSFDEHVILLEGEKTDHVYKHAVSTIQPATDFAAKTKRGVREGPARAASKPRVSAEEDVAHAAPQFAAGATEETPRQPVVVIRPKRRSIKNTDDKS
jgi:host factor-I protein